MSATLPRQPWHAERQTVPRDRLWILDADSLLVGRYDLATGEVSCCREGCSAALDAYVAGWYAATFPRAEATSASQLTGVGDLQTQASQMLAASDRAASQARRYADESATVAGPNSFPAPTGEPVFATPWPYFGNPWREPAPKTIGSLPAGAAPAVEPYQVPPTAWRSIELTPGAGPYETVDPHGVPHRERRSKDVPADDHTAAIFIKRMFGTGVASDPRERG